MENNIRPQRPLLERADWIVAGLMVIVVIFTILLLLEIKNFMPVWDTCSDDIEIAQQCGCIPCSWDLATEAYLGGQGGETLRQNCSGYES